MNIAIICVALVALAALVWRWDRPERKRGGSTRRFVVLVALGSALVVAPFAVTAINAYHHWGNRHSDVTFFKEEPVYTSVVGS